MSTHLKLNKNGEVLNTEDFIVEWVSEFPRDVDNEGQIIIYTGLYKWSDGTVHGEPEIKDDLIAGAKEIFRLHKLDSVNMIGYLYPHPNIIRLLEVDPNTFTTNTIYEFGYPGCKESNDYPVKVILLSSKEWLDLKSGKLNLPDDWKVDPIKL